MKTLLMIVFLLSSAAMQSFAHCEVPCGIYDDPARVKMMYEHIATIARSIDQIKELSAAKEKNYNQLVRWVNTKEDHANQLQHIITQYFMTQRLKPVPPSDPGYGKYIKELTLLHQLLVEAMKSKQTADPATCANMRRMLHEFQHSYFPEASKK